MVDLDAHMDGDRMVVRMDPGRPIELEDLSASFAALARMYERHHRLGADDAPKLYVTKLETGSVIAEIAPMAVIMGGLAVMDGGMIVTDFINRVRGVIVHFSGSPATSEALPSREDAKDIREFAKPLLGKNGASLSIKHAKFEKGSGEQRTLIEYNFDEGELNRAALNIDDQLQLPAPKEDVSVDTGKIHNEVMLFLEQAQRGPGKEKGRTGDRGRIPDISDKVLPVYFHKSTRPTKERMMLGSDNPFEFVYVVDAHATVMDGDAKAYTVTEIHDSLPRED